MLKGKNAIVTGSNRGIGRAIVEEFAQCGCNIWACARKENPEFEGQMARLSKEHGVWVKPVYFDLSSEEAIKEGFRQIYQEKLPINILVNNAGINYTCLFTMTSLKKIRALYETNLFSTFLVTQLVLRLMIKQKSGSVVNLSSIAAGLGHPGDAAYGTSKAAIEQFTKILAIEYAALGIRINAVAPGVCDTDMMRTVEKSVKGSLLSDIPLGRVAKPEEIAKAVRFLASDDASYITGEILKVSGGKR